MIRCQLTAIRRTNNSINLCNQQSSLAGSNYGIGRHRMDSAQALQRTTLGLLLSDIRRSDCVCMLRGTGDVAVGGIAAHRAVLQISRLELGDPVVLQRREFRAQIEFVELRGVVAENRALDGAVG